MSSLPQPQQQARLPQAPEQPPLSWDDYITTDAYNSLEQWQKNKARRVYEEKYGPIGWSQAEEYRTYGPAPEPHPPSLLATMGQKARDMVQSVLNFMHPSSSLSR